MKILLDPRPENPGHPTWLLLALCGPASSGAVRAELADALGCEVDQAAAVAGVLLSEPHPQVPAAAGFWRRGGVDTEPLTRWLTSLPETLDSGYLSDQAALGRMGAAQHLRTDQDVPD